MSIFAKIGDFLSGGFVSKAIDTVTEYFPPDMKEEDKLRLEAGITQALHDNAVELIKLNHEAEKQFHEQIAQHEGTANDLKGIPFFGSLMLFLRGSQRPIWGFGTMWLDFQWLHGNLGVDGVLTEHQEGSLWIINILVLGFLFGERAITNLMPLFTKLLDRILAGKEK